MINYTKPVLYNERQKNLIPFAFLYLIRVVSYLTLLYIITKLKNNETSRCNFDFLFELSVNIITLFQHNLYNFYIKTNAILENDIYKFNLTIYLKFNSLLLNLSCFYISETKIIRDCYIYKYVFIIIIISMIFDMMISLRLNCLKIKEKSFELFKKIGPDKKINSAYAVRKFLETLGGTNLFIIFAVVFTELIIEKVKYKILKLFILTLTIFQQLFISSYFNEENIFQRKFAILMSVFKLPLIFYIFYIYINHAKNYGSTIFYNEIIDCVNLILLNTIMTFVLIFDYLKFGSGLKEHLKKKLIYFDLSE